MIQVGVSYHNGSKKKYRIRHVSAFDGVWVYFEEHMLLNGIVVARKTWSSTYRKISSLEQRKSIKKCLTDFGRNGIV